MTPDPTPAANAVRTALEVSASALREETGLSWFVSDVGHLKLTCTRPDGAHVDAWQPQSGPANWCLWWKIAERDGHHAYAEITGHADDIRQAALAGIVQDREIRTALGIEWHPHREWSANGRPPSAAPWRKPAFRRMAMAICGAGASSMRTD
ncbi:MAG: hypothetical protein EPN20_12445 [Magnetospirillum sp.]|nr:MAG: hypothetical protein EPN20_12445 [Magnetospirillum sp.]